MTKAAHRDTPDLEALFDSIVESREPLAPAKPAAPAAQSPAPANPTTAPAKPAAVHHRPHEGAPHGKSTGVAHDGHDEAHGGAEDLIQRIGHLTRSLHDSLRELGYDKKIEKAAAAIPDTRDRLAYVANLTGQAADKVLTMTEETLPLQEAIGSGARVLSGRWQALMENRLTVAEFEALVAQTRAYLDDVPKQTAQSGRNLRDIMVAQDFHDLTGQVIRKITDMAQSMEAELVNLLVESVSPDVRAEVTANDGLMNGPVIHSEGRHDVVTSQAQVDDLLASLGF